MKFAVALATAIVACNAASLEAEAQITAEAEWSNSDYQGDNYYQYPQHQYADYSHEYGEVLPGADFNKQVWEFNAKKDIWDQNDYEERVKVEAEMLVALEALKEKIHKIDHDVSDIMYANQRQANQIAENGLDIYDNMKVVAADFDATLDRVHYLEHECQHTEYELLENRDALVLYCQQFAFAKVMVPQCAEILTCRDRRLPYRYSFPGDFVSHHSYHGHGDHVHDHHEPASSHGIELNVTGGNTQVPHGTNPELAAAAVNPYEAVIQVNGQSYIEPIHEINPDAVELACDDTGCALIPDDGNPYNDIVVADPSHSHDHLDIHDHHHDHDHYHNDHYDGGIDFENHLHDHDSHYHQEPASTHGIELNVTGGNTQVAPGTNPELAAAAVNPYEAVIQVSGESYIVPTNEINPDAVELACDDTGCALIPDDGNPYNDIVVEPTHSHIHHDHGYGTQYEEQLIPTYNDYYYSNSANDASLNTHGIDLPEVGGNVEVAEGTCPELAAAAVDENNAVIVHNGEAFHAPIDKINPDAVELACNMDGCALIQDDGNPDNDVTVPGM